MNIQILDRALNRIKIPKIIIKFIINLFTNRKNQVITEYGLTDPYDVLIGIDQGEVISLLIWIIYLDPLLTKIRKEKIGYTLKCRKLTSPLHTIEQDNIDIPAEGYMDDITWLTSKIDNLKKIIEIADSFYNVTNMKIN